MWIYVLSILFNVVFIIANTDSTENRITCVAFNLADGHPFQPPDYFSATHCGQTLLMSYTILHPSMDDTINICYSLDNAWTSQKSNITWTCWVPVPERMENVTRFAMKAFVNGVGPSGQSGRPLAGWAQVDVKYGCDDHCAADQLTVTQPDSRTLTAVLSVHNASAMWLSELQNVTHTCKTLLPSKIRAKCEINFSGVPAGDYAIEIFTRPKSITSVICGYKANIHVPICRGCTLTDVLVTSPTRGVLSTNIVMVIVGAIVLITVSVVVFIYIKVRCRRVQGRTWCHKTPSHSDVISPTDPVYSAIHFTGANTSDLLDQGTGDSDIERVRPLVADGRTCQLLDDKGLYPHRDDSRAYLHSDDERRECLHSDNTNRIPHLDGKRAGLHSDGTNARAHDDSSRGCLHRDDKGFISLPADERRPCPNCNDGSACLLVDVERACQHRGDSQVFLHRDIIHTLPNDRISYQLPEFMRDTTRRMNGFVTEHTCIGRGAV